MIPDLLPFCTSPTIHRAAHGRKGFPDLSDVALRVFFDIHLEQQKVVQHLRGVEGADASADPLGAHASDILEINNTRAAKRRTGNPADWEYSKARAG